MQKTINRKSNGIQKIQDVPLRERVYNQIKNLILTNKLYPGEVLVIDHLASELGLSHTPVREALAMLELDGLVTTTQHRNPHVVDLRESDIEELYEMRILLEPWAILRSALTITNEAIKDINRRLKIAYEDAKNNDFNAHMESDIQLHHLILRSSGNEFFWQLASRVNDQSIRIRTLVEATGSGPEVLGIIDEHFEITEALFAREPQKAHDKLLSHLQTGKIRTLSALNRLPKEQNLFRV